MEFERDQTLAIIDEHRDQRGALIGVLQDIQDRFGWLPREALEMVGAELGYHMNHIYNVATFYKAFSLTPRGEHICKVCMGTACHVRGGARILEELERQLKIEPGETKSTSSPEISGRW